MNINTYSTDAISEPLQKGVYHYLIKGGQCGIVLNIVLDVVLIEHNKKKTGELPVLLKSNELCTHPGNSIFSS